MSSMLEVEGASGGYGPVTILRDIDMHVDEGEVVVVLGANGAGKTTLLRAICGDIRTEGRFAFEGVDLPRSPEKVARAGIAHVPQGRGTFAEMTTDENLRLGAVTRSDREVRADIDHWYEVFPRLGERRDQAAGSMSGGEQQMLAIARAMMLRPRLLLLDEPSLGLAPLITKDLFERLGRLNRDEGLTVLVVEQNANLALDIGQRAYVIETGRIVATGAAEDLRRDDAIRKSYLGF
ncbi:ABC transporter ATP-binding protein [Iamia majanohamensis]|uniref:ABC transporter ATP-binding protein n=1 Tax=Iamia majanohamensis TaxID=467976 RepID=A0AAE9Y892_9ACTN|nr:ABC transporter ATP-binding protein [Iamia majanohamensis]WCO67546.1 ABC transporter ATP-binding protein [Iamia majanohamensis]